MFPAGSGGGPLRRHPTTQEVTIAAGFQFIRGVRPFRVFRVALASKFHVVGVLTACNARKCLSCRRFLDC